MLNSEPRQREQRNLKLETGFKFSRIATSPRPPPRRCSFVSLSRPLLVVLELIPHNNSISRQADGIEVSSDHLLEQPLTNKFFTMLSNHSIKVRRCCRPLLFLRTFKSSFPRPHKPLSPFELVVSWPRKPDAEVSRVRLIDFSSQGLL